MAIYTGKTNMIDKVVVTDGAASEEMDFVYVTNAAGNRELVFEQKPPAPDDNTQTNPPIMRKWSANIKGDVTGGLFWGALSQKQFSTSVGISGGGRSTANTSFAYQVAPYLTLKADGKGGYTFSPRTGIRGNGWTKLQSPPLRFPAESELTHLGALAPYTGTLPVEPANSQVSGLPLSNSFNKDYKENWIRFNNEVRRTSMAVSRRRYTGQTSMTITPYTSNGTYYGYIESPGTIGNIGPFSGIMQVKFTRTSNYDEINITGYSSLDGAVSSSVYIIRLKKNVVSKEEPPMSELVDTTNIARGIGGNPKAFRMGFGFNFTVDVKGEYV